ncbi:hypothetical protein [Saccharopolyspora pogona]|nr:hypothetical protein [Saccharopolyspora pogona]
MSKEVAGNLARAILISNKMEPVDVRSIAAHPQPMLADSSRLLGE